MPSAASAATGCSRSAAATTRVAELELTRDGGLRRRARSGQVGLRLLKTTGSAFTRFARDDATTLPERSDRPLFIHLDVHWRYADPADALAGDPARYVAAVAGARRRLRPCSTSSSPSRSSTSCTRSGSGCSTRFPALAEVAFRAENHTYDPVPGMDPGADRRAYTAAFPAWGLITLTLTR